MDLPEKDILIANGKAKYDITKKYGYVRYSARNNKYNRRRIINRVDSTHGENAPYKPGRIGNVTLIENGIIDTILQMEHDYGGGD